TSGLPRLADILRIIRHVSKVPTTEAVCLLCFRSGIPSRLNRNVDFPALWRKRHKYSKLAFLCRSSQTRELEFLASLKTCWGRYYFNEVVRLRNEAGTCWADQ